MTSNLPVTHNRKPALQVPKTLLAKPHVDWSARARALLIAGKNKELISEYKPLFYKHHLDVESCGWFAYACYMADDYKEAASAYQYIISHNKSGNLDWYKNLADCYVRLGLFQQGQLAFDTYVAHHPNKAEAYSEIGDALCSWDPEGKKNEQNKIALNAYKQSVSLDPTAKAYHKLGWCYNLLAKWSEAENAYRKALNLSDQDHVMYHDLVFLYLGRERPQEAMSVSRKMVEKCLRDSNAVNIADDLRYEGQLAESLHLNLAKDFYTMAVETYKRAIQFEPKSPYAHYGLGLAYICQREHDKTLAQHDILKLLNKELAADLLRRFKIEERR